MRSNLDCAVYSVIFKIIVSRFFLFVFWWNLVTQVSPVWIIPVWIPAICLISCQLLFLWEFSVYCSYLRTLFVLCMYLFISFALPHLFGMSVSIFLSTLLNEVFLVTFPEQASTETRKNPGCEKDMVISFTLGNYSKEIGLNKPRFKSEV